jgi:hypothetical protein
MFKQQCSFISVVKLDPLMQTLLFSIFLILRVYVLPLSVEWYRSTDGRNGVYIKNHADYNLCYNKELQLLVTVNRFKGAKGL